NELVLVIEQASRDPVGVAQLVAPDERERRGDRRAPPPRVIGRGELIENVPGPLQERTPEHLPRAECSELTVTNRVVTAEVESRERLELCVRRGARLGLFRHDPHRPGPDLVRIVLEQPLDLVQVHAREVAGGREHRTHPDAHELVVALREVAPVFPALELGRLAPKPRHERASGQVSHLAKSRDALAGDGRSSGPSTRRLVVRGGEQVADPEAPIRRTESASEPRISDVVRLQRQSTFTTSIGPERPLSVALLWLDVRCDSPTVATLATISPAPPSAAIREASWTPLPWKTPPTRVASEA